MCPCFVRRTRAKGKDTNAALQKMHCFERMGVYRTAVAASSTTDAAIVVCAENGTGPAAAADDDVPVVVLVVATVLV